MFIFCFCSRPTLFNIVSKNDLRRLYFYRDFYLYCSRPIQHQYYCIVIVYYCFLLWCWMNIKVEVEVEVEIGPLWGTDSQTDRQPHTWRALKPYPPNGCKL